MKPTTGHGAMALVLIVLFLELAGARAYVVQSAHANPADVCFGYAICQ